MSHAAERARDLLAALELLVRHRVTEPVAYRTVHGAASAAIGALHEEMLDPRVGDFDAVAGHHAELARRLRDLPRPSTGQATRVPVGDAFGAMLSRGRGTGRSLDALLADLASGVGPSVEQAVRDGLRELFGAVERAGEWLGDPAAQDDDLWQEPTATSDEPGDGADP